MISTKRALICVDLQNDFLPGGALATKGADEIIPLINGIQKHFQLVVATKDWHPSNHGSFAATHQKKPGEEILLDGIPQVLWPVHCVQGSWGVEFSPLFERERVEKIFYKGVDVQTDSYSSFFDNAKRRATGLKEFLFEKDVKELFIAGIATDYCVKYTAMDARELGFKVSVIIDACRGIDLHPGDVRRSIEEMKEVGVQIISSTEISEEN